MLGDTRIQEAAVQMLQPVFEHGLNLTPGQLFEEWRNGVLDPREPSMFDILVLCGICAKDLKEFLRVYEFWPGDGSWDPRSRRAQLT